MMDMVRGILLGGLRYLRFCQDSATVASNVSYLLGVGLRTRPYVVNTNMRNL